MNELEKATFEGLRYRINRMYESLNRQAPAAVSGFPPKIFRSDKFHLMYQDFRGGMTDDQIREVLESLVYHVAHVKDPLKNWLRKQKRGFQVVEDFINSREASQIIIDLANVHKHGYPLDRPRSRYCPRIGEVTRPLQIGTRKSGPGSAVYTIDPITGKPAVATTGSGYAGVVYSGDVLDKIGTRIGDLVEIASEAVADWERLLGDLGVPRIR